MVDTRAVADTPAMQESRFNMAENVEGWGSGHVAELMLPKLVGRSTIENHPEVVVEIESIISRTNPVAIAAAQRGMAHRPDTTPVLARIEIPTLCLVGAEDVITPPEAVQTMANAMPNASLTVIEAAGHMCPMENPSAFNEALGEFLARNVVR
jgi:pimeloyl-ACP methyl ester carboxylesterase